jgi:hypothetical protein
MLVRRPACDDDEKGKQATAVLAGAGQDRYYSQYGFLLGSSSLSRIRWKNRGPDGRNPPRQESVIRPVEASTNGVKAAVRLIGIMTAFEIQSFLIVVIVMKIGGSTKTDVNRPSFAFYNHVLIGQSPKLSFLGFLYHDDDPTPLVTTSPLVH